MTLEPLFLAVLAAAFLPAGFHLWNWFVYQTPKPAPQKRRPRISILIPARNEESSIAGAVDSALQSRDSEVEVVVLDDQSTDRTAALVLEFAARDPRVRLESAPPLPEGWCGKQHACHILAGFAQYDLFLFQDADVRLAPGAAASLAAHLERVKAGLVSGFPHQQTGTLLEKLVIPLIHFVLLGFLPMWFLRHTRIPGFGTGCGQLMLASREAYFRCGGHSAIRTSLHDGVTLPPAFRRHGVFTDLVDATDLATCRMYRSAGEVWRGLAKNATEGLGSPGRLPFFSLLLGLGQILPVFLLAASLAGAAPFRPFLPHLAAATVLSVGPRFVNAIRFRQSLIGAVLHPLGVACLLAIQWYALIRRLLGHPATWKSRSYKAATANSPT